jgi:hypothetical protein
MPLTKRCISQPFYYGHPDFYHQYDETTILQDVAMAQLTGALHQLGILLQLLCVCVVCLRVLDESTRFRRRIPGCVRYRAVRRAVPDIRGHDGRNQASDCADNGVVTFQARGVLNCAV